MTKARRKIVEENDHFILSADYMGKKILRYVVKCRHCNKEKTFAGGVKHIKWKCCGREFEKTND